MPIKKVTLVEDEVSIRELIIAMLQRYEKTDFAIGAHLKYDFTPEESDVYMFDHHIKDDITGSEWIKRRNLYEFHPDRRILMSANPHIWRDKGIKGYCLTKPFNWEQLYKTLDKILGL